jgi:hypothetical protein
VAYVRGSNLIGEEVAQFEKRWLNWKRGESVGGEWRYGSVSD